MSFLYYESIKGELQTRPINDCRGDERLKTKDEESTRLGYTGFLGELKCIKNESHTNSRWMLTGLLTGLFGY